jgi:acyl-CoA synthetase (AMP-forming)/AMP-acid ligase II
MMVSWAIHRLNGISSPANAAYFTSELAFQLKSCRAKCIFTCSSLLPTALEAANIAKIPTNLIYLCTVSGTVPSTMLKVVGKKTLKDLISRGKTLTDLETQRWSKG